MRERNTSDTLTLWLTLSKPAAYNEIEVTDYSTNTPTQADIDYLDSDERIVKVTIDFPADYFNPKPVDEVQFIAPAVPNPLTPKAVDPSVDRHSAFD
jgi:hypothetical protein